MDTFDDFQARQAARDVAPEGLEGTSAADWAAWAVSGTRTPSQDIVGRKAEEFNNARQAALGELVYNEEQQLAQEQPPAEWEAEPEQYFAEPEEDPYQAEYLDEQLAGLDAESPEFTEWQQEYDARMQQWQQDEAERQMRETESIIENAARQAATQNDVRQSYESGALRSNMAEAAAVMREAAMQNGATTVAEADAALVEHFGGEESLASHIAEAAGMVTRREAIANRIFNGPGWRGDDEVRRRSQVW